MFTFHRKCLHFGIQIVANKIDKWIYIHMTNSSAICSSNKQLKVPVSVQKGKIRLINQSGANLVFNRNSWIGFSSWKLLHWDMSALWWAVALINFWIQTGGVVFLGDNFFERERVCACVCEWIVITILFIQKWKGCLRKCILIEISWNVKCVREMNGSIIWPSNSLKVHKNG